MKQFIDIGGRLFNIDNISSIEMGAHSGGIADCVIVERLDGKDVFIQFESCAGAKIAHAKVAATLKA